MKLYDTGGEDVYADCPFCRRKRKLGISRTKMIFHCFWCSSHDADWGGTCGLIKMVSLLEKCHKGLAIALIFKESGIPDERPKAPVLPHESSRLPTTGIPLHECRESDYAQYLLKRGCWRLISKSYGTAIGDYAGRVILPVHHDRELVGFEAKAIDSRTSPKALYPPWFVTSNYIYWVSQEEAQKSDTLVVTESILDAETVNETSVGLFGSSLKEGQLCRLLELPKLKRLIWFLDGDAWPKLAKRRILSMTSAFFENWVVPTPKDQDPNSLGVTQCEHSIKDAVLCRNHLDFVTLLAREGML